MCVEAAWDRAGIRGAPRITLPLPGCQLLSPAPCFFRSRGSCVTYGREGSANQRKEEEKRRRFWEEAWQKGNIGFHKEEVHRYLRRHYIRLAVATGETVFVPLCGKSRDLLWLAEEEAAVCGVELSTLAVDAFFAENALEAARQSYGPFESWRSGTLQILLGDLFALVPADLAEVRAVYDRASLVAFPPDMRRRYADHLAVLLPSGCRILLVSYTYEQSELAGPPFSVPPAEVEELFGDAFTIELLEEEDALSDHPTLRARGLTALTESARLLVRR
ncbi:putative SAM-dependent methyltransferase [Desulfuromonas soudanensis]|uniref:Thiopurine S-methyltransferase n=1 Tax=Desulfuromonas soudanensis TaxID=1603606 RepID=A0A0M4DFN2_9BACT|nr:thiopurine S-methyltransferase [Desulfuromonas soudanensis]ALC15562.1 putative SAM-dependent methyltransferase [Desulfuromonas soudanensis]